MNKYQLYTLGGVLLAAMSLGACTQLPATATKDEKEQANFDSACAFLKGAAATAKPALPLVTEKLGEDGTLAVQSALAVIDTTCSKPLDVNNSAAITQAIWDAGGKVLEIVIKAKSS